MSGVKFNAGYKRKNKNVSLALDSKQIMKEVSQLRNLLNTEFKYNDTSGTISNQNTVANFILLNGITQGDTASTRTGNTIRVKSVEINSQFILNAGLSSSVVRQLLVIPLKTDGIVPNYADIIQSGGTNTIAPRNLLLRSNFLILKDEKIDLVAGHNSVVTHKCYRKVDIKTVYDVANTLISGISNHPIYVIYISNQATLGPAINYYHRIRYLDN